MNRMILAAIGLLAPMTLIAVPANAQAVRNYDCTKAGNANKSVCKSAAVAAKPAPATRNYDCSKAGNANKAVCKSAVPAAKPTPVAATTSTTTRHYDCTKAGNANKAACKGMTPVATPAAPSAAAPTASNHSATAVQHRTTTTSTTGQNTNAGDPNGATAKCRDGSMSFSAHRSGTCSRHGGVAQFY